MDYLVKILVGSKEGVLNPEAKGIKEALDSFGFKDIRDFSIARCYYYITDKETEKAARREAEKISAKYLADSVNNGYEIASIEKLKR